MSIYQALRRALTTKGPKPNSTGAPTVHTPVHTTRPFRHVPVVQKHYGDDLQLHKEQEAPRIDREFKYLDLERDLLALERRLKGLGYRDSNVLHQLWAKYGASRETRWALKGVERRLNEEKERKKVEDLEQELRYYRGWDKKQL
ncbi:uncharacterized protein FSUBG_7832 [Fusarium subglutinans]|uniref:Uncharacterized protein n=1 Tax=Gibberella subglutinans TaxID=42677 RepID=A0A8H5PSE5_GIBSU|nr:uncharacterized protein FSUBG_7832 [Fusarium subglutinans]KAF5602157.1 hypothetical protein FSUBG_7832 [Fusarium subglutinans]